MSEQRGIIALMGSGELTSSMVEVHKDLIARLLVPSNPVFLDTPAGFQLNVEQLAEKALEYFYTRIQHPMSAVSYKSKTLTPEFEAEKAFNLLRRAGFILIGPGSPTYAVHQWKQTPIPDILIERIQAGGCLVAASAAALTVGRFTLPVYEIYKVGQDLFWAEGLDILGRFGFGLVVIPHWNNAEGGTHDTRFCYMGEARFQQLESLLPEGIRILGLDEHTACLIDLAQNEAVVCGIGRVILRARQKEIVFEKGDRFSLEIFRGGEEAVWKDISPPSKSSGPQPSPDDSFWNTIHALEDAFNSGLDAKDARKSINALLELDKLIWNAELDTENPEFISQAREIFRELIVYLGLKLDSISKDSSPSLIPLIDFLLKRREHLRRRQQWEEADAIRQNLEAVGIIIDDTEKGPVWRWKSA